MRKGMFYFVLLSIAPHPLLPLFTTAQTATSMCPTNMGESDKPPTTIEWEPMSPGFIAWMETQPLGYHIAMAHGEETTISLLGHGFSDKPPVHHRVHSGVPGKVIDIFVVFTLNWDSLASA